MLIYTDKNECLTVSCMHGGTCNNTMGSFKCEGCDEGWEGQLCDKGDTLSLNSYNLIFWLIRFFLWMSLLSFANPVRVSTFCSM